MSDIVPGLSRDLLVLLAVAGAGAGALALLLSLAALWRVRGLRTRLRSATSRVAVPVMPTGQGQEALRRVGLVRYDAFPDSAGMLSFSAALLDDGGNGIVITSINGRAESRTYAKAVAAGEASQALSPEESEAITGALSGAEGVLVGLGSEVDGQGDREPPR